MREGKKRTCVRLVLGDVPGDGIVDGADEIVGVEGVAAMRRGKWPCRVSELFKFVAELDGMGVHDDVHQGNSRTGISGCLGRSLVSFEGGRGAKVKVSVRLRHAWLPNQRFSGQSWRASLDSSSLVHSYRNMRP